MKTYLFIIVFCLLLQVVFAQQQSAKVIKDDAVLKERPFENQTTILSLPIGTELVLVSERYTNGFYKASYQNREGFVHESFIEIITKDTKPLITRNRPIDLIHELENILKEIAQSGNLDMQKCKSLFMSNARIVNDLTNTTTLVDIEKYFEDFSIAYRRELRIKVIFYDVKEETDKKHILVNYGIEVEGTLKSEKKPTKNKYRRLATIDYDSDKNLKIVSIISVVKKSNKIVIPPLKGKKKKVND